MKSLKETKGITLIALVITIIVLLIMAGITIVSISGENGIMQMASEARDSTSEENGRELIAMKVMESLNNYGKIDYSLLNERLKEIPELKYNDNYLSDLNVITFENMPVTVYLYGIPFRIDYNGSVDRYKKYGYSQDVIRKLKLKLSAATADERSPYVKYNGELFRVMYDMDSGYRWIELISDKSVGTVTLGYNDPTRPSTVPGYDFVSTNVMYHERARWSYNNAFTTLNNKAQTYLTDLADRARCVGTNPNMRIVDYENYMFSSFRSYMLKYGWNNKIKSGDLNYSLYPYPFTIDRNQLDRIGIKTIGTKYWLASRYIMDEYDRTSFEIRYVSTDGFINGEAGGIMDSDGKVYGGTATNGFRVIVRLNQMVKIIRGDGTKTNPYELGI